MFYGVNSCSFHWLRRGIVEYSQLILRSAGYLVVPAYSLKEAVARFQDGDFDLVLLCQSIPTKEKDRLTCWIRASGSRVPVLSVSGSPCHRDAFTDATVENDQNLLLDGMREALKKAEMPTARASTCRDKKQVAAIQGKQSPKSSDGYEQPTRPVEEHHVPLARAG